MDTNKKTWLNVTITKHDKFSHWAQVKAIRVEENKVAEEFEDVVNITLTYTNGYDEVFTMKRSELKSIETQLEML
jgi:hypothetical protein